MKQLNCKKTFVACALFAIASVPFITAGCKKPAAEKKEADSEVIVYAVNCLKVSEGNLDEYIEQGGDVDSVNAVNVLPDMSGKISGIVAKVGQYVTKNQVIAYVDASRPGYDFSESPVKAPIAGRITAITPT
ncbi:MAG: efflux RND transporter periplasmic adaptor subunit, partial [Spirochaetales bacterium]|nr:efflux RND transporter periplasmic adaptor subunit [Spirochaetales bacterium]